MEIEQIPNIYPFTRKGEILHSYPKIISLFIYIIELLFLNKKMKVKGALWLKQHIKYFNSEKEKNILNDILNFYISTYNLNEIKANNE